MQFSLHALQNDMISAINSPSTVVDIGHRIFHVHHSSSYLIYAFHRPLHSTLLMRRHLCMT